MEVIFFLKYFLAWLPMLLLAIANGVLREFVYRKLMNELAAHQLSTITLIFLFTIYIRFALNKLPPASVQQSITIGIYWLVLTLIFEFGFGRYRGNSWHTLLHDYNLAQGRIWIAVPLWLSIAPFIFFKILHRQ